MRNLTLFIFITYTSLSVALDTRRFTIPALAIDPAATEQLAREVFLTIDSWGMKPPSHLEFASTCESYNAVSRKFGLEYDPQTHMISYQGLEVYAQKYHGVFLAHEYAHTLFRASLDLIDPNLKPEMQLSLDYRALLRTALISASPTACEYTALPNVVEYERRFARLDLFTFAALRLGSYDELFADIVAVLWAGSGDAMYQALGGDTVNWTGKYYVTLPEGYRGRDFTYNMPIEHPSIQNRTFRFYDFLGSKSDMYNALDPVRTYLWQNYLRNLEPKDYATFLTSYLRAVGSQYRWLQQTPIWEIPLHEMNERFMESLKQELTPECPFTSPRLCPG